MSHNFQRLGGVSPGEDVSRNDQRSRLLGREAECGRIDELLDAARRGQSAALVIDGEPGIGKSALLHYAAAHARDMTVLSARGIQAEAEIPFSTLDQLLRPVLDRLDQIPAPQAAALASALAIGPAAPTDRFAIGAATLSLLASAAEDKALLALIDDVHWADASSRDALVFASHRLGAEGIVVLFAVRHQLRDRLGAHGLPEIMLARLSPDACVDLLAEARPNVVVAASVAATLCGATGGNPLALLQLVPVLSDAELAGTEPLRDPLPALGVEDAFLERVHHAPIDVQRALVVAATSDSGAMDEVLAAAATLGIDAGTLGAAERAGLVTVAAGTLSFPHPLMRSAVYNSASPDERRAAHRALAQVLAAKDDRERRAWHLAAATAAPDEDVAAALEQAANSARLRSGYAAAAAAFERAARLTPDPQARARRLVSAAEAAQFAGQLEFAAALLDEALGYVDDPTRRAELLQARAVIDVWRGRLRVAREVLLAEAGRVEVASPALAAAMLFNATIPSIMVVEVDTAFETAQRAWSVAQRADEATQAVAAAVLGVGLIAVGEAKEAEHPLARARGVIEGTDPAELAHAAIRHFVWNFYIVLERYDQAGRLFDASIEGARSASAPGLLPLPLAFRAELRFRTGRWHDAFVDASESVRLAEETGQHTQLPHSLATLARVEAAQGRERECRTHCARALELSRQHGSQAILLYAGSALGLLELGLGRSEQAVDELEALARLTEERPLPEPGIVPWGADVIEAYVRAGRSGDARASVADFEQQAEHAGRIWALAAAARCRGLLADDDAFEDCFKEARRWHEQTPTPFERARTELCYGERLRRARRLVEARTPLRHALGVFEQLGAAPWAERARTELRASGDAPRMQRGHLLERLTAQELQVARTVAGGATNREAAAALFLSPKTIEFHLRNVYRKLDVRSRSELARSFVEQVPA